MGNGDGESQFLYGVLPASSGELFWGETSPILQNFLFSNLEASEWNLYIYEKLFEVLKLIAMALICH